MPEFRIISNPSLNPDDTFSCNGKVLTYKNGSDICIEPTVKKQLIKEFGHPDITWSRISVFDTVSNQLADVPNFTLHNNLFWGDFCYTGLVTFNHSKYRGLLSCVGLKEVWDHDTLVFREIDNFDFKKSIESAYKKWSDKNGGLNQLIDPFDPNFFKDAILEMSLYFDQ